MNILCFLKLFRFAIHRKQGKEFVTEAHMHELFLSETESVLMEVFEPESDTIEFTDSFPTTTTESTEKEMLVLDESNKSEKSELLEKRNFNLRDSFYTAITELSKIDGVDFFNMFFIVEPDLSKYEKLRNIESADQGRLENSDNFYIDKDNSENPLLLRKNASEYLESLQLD